MLTIPQVAERLGVSESSVITWCREGKFPNAFKDSGARYNRWLVPAEDLESFTPPLRRFETFSCVKCGATFHPRRGNDKYCSAKCARKVPDGVCPSCKKRPSQEGYKLCTECIAKSRRMWANRSPEAKAKIAQQNRRWRENNRDRSNEHGRKHVQKLKGEIFGHYGTVCACCGEKDRRFLTIDHINGGGNKHRKELYETGQGGARFYNWLRRNNYPDGFQVLCYNCNLARAKFGGICPHKIPLDKGDA